MLRKNLNKVLDAVEQFEEYKREEDAPMLRQIWKCKVDTINNVLDTLLPDLDSKKEELSEIITNINKHRDNNLYCKFEKPYTAKYLTADEYLFIKENVLDKTNIDFGNGLMLVPIDNNNFLEINGENVYYLSAKLEKDDNYAIKLSYTVNNITHTVDFNKDIRNKVNIVLEAWDQDAKIILDFLELTGD